jgi:hypothetical protein
MMKTEIAGNIVKAFINYRILELASRLPYLPHFLFRLSRFSLAVLKTFTRVSVNL